MDGSREILDSDQWPMTSLVGAGHTVGLWPTGEGLREFAAQCIMLGLFSDQCIILGLFSDQCIMLGLFSDTCFQFSLSPSKPETRQHP